MLILTNTRDSYLPLIYNWANWALSWNCRRAVFESPYKRVKVNGLGGHLLNDDHRRLRFLLRKGRCLGHWILYHRLPDFRHEICDLLFRLLLAVCPDSFVRSPCGRRNLTGPSLEFAISLYGCCWIKYG